MTKSLLHFFTVGCLGLVPLWSLENTNIPGYDDLYRAFAYDRIRGQLSLKHSDLPDYLATISVDNETLFIDSDHSLSNKTSIYRAHLSYQGSRHSWTIGKQRIPLGVGKFWNPIDVFNPIDIQAMEPGERKGTDSIHYEYSLSRLSSLDATLADGKAALCIKGYLDVADLALITEWDQERDLKIIGWELEGDIGTTGVEMRSEGGFFYRGEEGLYSSEFVLGAEYGFVNSLVLNAEYHYNDEIHLSEVGLAATIQPDLLWICSVTSVVDMGDGSGFVAPTVEYSLSDEMTLSGGAFLYYGGAGARYGYLPDRYFLRWFIHF